MRCYSSRNPMGGLWVVVLAAATAIPAAGRGEGRPIPSWLKGELELSAGLELSSGDYGGQGDIDILYLPFSIAYRPDDFGLTPYRADWIELKVTIPYLRTRSSVYPDGGTSPSGRQTDQGLGDVITRLSYLLAPPGDTWIPFIEIAARVKAPTADEDDYLGTGASDVSLELTLSKQLGAFTPFGSLGHRWMGDPRDYDLNDRWLASVGLVYRVSSRWNLGLVYEWREAAASWSQDDHELLPYTSLRVSPNLRLQLYGIAGASDGSPDFGAGLQVRVAVPLR